MQADPRTKNGESICGIEPATLDRSIRLATHTTERETAGRQALNSTSCVLSASFG